jgi:hypothetical protein
VFEGNESNDEESEALMGGGIYEGVGVGERKQSILIRQPIHSNKEIKNQLLRPQIYQPFQSSIS